MLTTFAAAKPTPLKMSQQDNFLYKKDGTLKEMYANICPEFGFDPEEFAQKPLSVFQDPNIGYIVQVTRYNFFESRRQSRIQALKSVAAKKYPQYFPQLTPQKQSQPVEESATQLPVPKDRRASKVSRGSILVALSSRRKSDAEKSKILLSSALPDSMHNTTLTPKNKTNNNVSFDPNFIKESTKAEPETQLNSSYTGNFQQKSPEKPNYQSAEDMIKERLKKKAFELERHIGAKVKKENLHDIKTHTAVTSWQKKAEKLNRSFDGQQKARQTKLNQKRAQESEIKERIEDIQKEQEKARQKLETSQQQRMKKLEKQKEEQVSLQRSVFEDKFKKFQLTQEKIFERRKQEDRQLVEGALEKIEQKLERGVGIRDELFRNRMKQLIEHSQRVNQLYELHKYYEKQQSEESFLGMLNKLQKKSIVSNKAKRQHSADREDRFELVRENRNEEEKKFQQKINQIEQKHQKNSDWLKTRHHNLAELIQARKELRGLKAQEISKHLHYVAEANENKVAQTLLKHRERSQKKKLMIEYLQIMNEKLNRHARLQEKIALQSRTPDILTKTPERLNVSADIPQKSDGSNV